MSNSQLFRILSLVLGIVSQAAILGLVIYLPWPYGSARWEDQQYLPLVAGIALICALGANLCSTKIFRSVHLLALAVLLLIGFLQAISVPEWAWNSFGRGARFESEVQSLASELGVEASASEMFANSGVALSISPEHTKAALSVFSSAVAVFVASALVFRTRLSATILLGVLMLNGTCFAVFGIYQALVAEEMLLPGLGPSSFGTFVSRNSAPQFLAVAIGAAIGLFVYQHREQKRGDQRYTVKYPSVNPAARLRRLMDDVSNGFGVSTALPLVALVILATAVLIANSRGGTIAGGLAGLACITVIITKLKGSTTNVLLFAGIIVLVGSVLVWSELDTAIGQRLDSINEEAYERDNARIDLWQLVLGQRESYLLGSGLGTFHFAIVPEYAGPKSVWFYHGENVYLEVMSNLGILGLLAALALVVATFQLILKPVKKDLLSKSLKIAALFPVVAISLQSLVDFSLFIPGVCIPFVVLLGALLGRDEVMATSTRKTRKSRSSAESGREENQTEKMRKHKSKSRSRRKEKKSGDDRLPGFAPSALVGTVFLLSLAAYGSESLFAFGEAERIARLSARTEEKTIVNVTDLKFEDHVATKLQRSRTMQENAKVALSEGTSWPVEFDEATITRLSRPEFFTAAFFESSDPTLKPLMEIVAANTQAVDWLNACSSDFSDVISGSPLDGRGYWGMLRSNLGQLSNEELSQVYLRILMTYRHSPKVLLASGQHALLTGHKEEGLRLLQELVPGSSFARYHLSRMVGGALKPEDLFAILPESQLERVALADQLRRAGKTDILKAVINQSDLALAMEQASRATDWTQIAWAAEQIEDSETRLAALKKATLANPLNHSIAYSHAKALYEAEDFESALEEINSALSLAKDNAIYKKLRTEIQQRME